MGLKAKDGDKMADSTSPVTAEAWMPGASGEKKQRPRACEQCRLQKVKCVLVDPVSMRGPCIRCVRNKTNCILTESRHRPRKAAS
jgi:hypothetical protein